MPTSTATAGQSSHAYRDLTDYYNGLAGQWWTRKNKYYFQGMVRLLRFLVPRGSRVLEIGCANGDLLAALDPGYGVGVDLSPRMVEVARGRYPHLRFLQMDAHRLAADPSLVEPFDYILLCDLVGDL